MKWFKSVMSRTEPADGLIPNYRDILNPQWYRTVNLSVVTLVVGNMMIIKIGIIVGVSRLFRSSVVSLRSAETLLLFSNSVVSYNSTQTYYCSYYLSMRQGILNEYGSVVTQSNFYISLFCMHFGLEINSTEFYHMAYTTAFKFDLYASGNGNTQHGH